MPNDLTSFLGTVVIALHTKPTSQKPKPMLQLITTYAKKNYTARLRTFIIEHLQTSQAYQNLYSAFLNSCISNLEHYLEDPGVDGKVGKSLGLQISHWDFVEE